MTLTTLERVEARAAGIVGRDAQLAVLRSLLGEAGPAVVFVSGIGGIGKSALILKFAAEAQAEGATVLRLDSGAIEPTERGFLAALQDVAGGELSSAGEAAQRLSDLGSPV